MLRALRYILYAITGIALGGLAFEVATLPSVSALRDQNPATTSMIETRNREARDSGAPPKRVQIWMPLEKISQPLAKNLYLSSQRSVMRKGEEAIITYFMERDLSKRRILELYFNVIEWGDGVYGAEAASQYYFHKPAANLSAREAAFLSAMIPNPRTVFNPQVNPKRVARRQRIILRGMPNVKMPPGTGCLGVRRA